MAGSFQHRQTIYSGPVDEYFGYRYGKLQYRSLEFKLQTHHRRCFNPAPVVNFPNENSYTRVHGIQIPNRSGARQHDRRL